MNSLARTDATEATEHAVALIERTLFCKPTLRSAIRLVRIYRCAVWSRNSAMCVCGDITICRSGVYAHELWSLPFRLAAAVSLHLLRFVSFLLIAKYFFGANTNRGREDTKTPYYADFDLYIFIFAYKKERKTCFAYVCLCMCVCVCRVSCRVLWAK